MEQPPNYLDFLVALDDHLKTTGWGYVPSGHLLFSVAREAGLTSEHVDQVVVRSVGQLVHDGLIAHGVQGAGDRQPMPPGLYWSQYDLSRVGDYRLTPAGLAEADRVRRQRREALTDKVIGLALPSLSAMELTEGQRHAIKVPLTSLRHALDADRHEAAIGAAKDLVESACKLVATRAGEPVPADASVASLVKLALKASSSTPVDGDIARRLAGVIDAVGSLRNAVGTGHGRAEQAKADAELARLAASSACAIARFVLSAAT